jgi:outer membrane immunogenic protein
MPPILKLSGAAMFQFLPRSFRFAAILIVISNSVSAVSAQEVPADVKPAIWSGFYAGLHGGWGKLRDSPLRGLTGGGHLGFNHQSGVVVVGIEGDYSHSLIDYSDTRDFGPFVGPVYREAGLDYLASLRGRIGFTSPDGVMMIYGTAGYGVSQISGMATAPRLGITQSIDYSVHGIVAGAGVEIKLSSSVSGRVEMLQYWMGQDGPSWERAETVRAGLSIHLPPN